METKADIDHTTNVGRGAETCRGKFQSIFFPGSLLVFFAFKEVGFDFFNLG